MCAYRRCQNEKEREGNAVTNALVRNSKKQAVCLAASTFQRYTIEQSVKEHTEKRDSSSNSAIFDLFNFRFDQNTPTNIN